MLACGLRQVNRFLDLLLHSDLKSDNLACALQQKIQDTTEVRGSLRTSSGPIVGAFCYVLLKKQPGARVPRSPVDETSDSCYTQDIDLA